MQFIAFGVKNQILNHFLKYDPLHEIPRIIELLARQLESSIADLKLGK